MKIRLICLAFATAALAAAETEADFGLIGIAAFEDARLTAYCDGSVAPNPCAVTFTFHDINGRTLKQATLTLQPGTGGFLDACGAAAAPPDLLRSNGRPMRPSGYSQDISGSKCRANSMASYRTRPTTSRAGSTR